MQTENGWVALKCQTRRNMRSFFSSFAHRLCKTLTFLAELARKRWQQLRERYRKELKFAIRDDFAYKPKWPYFFALRFLDDHLRRDTPTTRARSLLIGRNDGSGGGHQQDEFLTCELKFINNEKFCSHPTRRAAVCSANASLQWRRFGGENEHRQLASQQFPQRGDRVERRG